MTIARWAPFQRRSTALLEHQWAPVFAGFITIAIVHFVWRSFGEPGVVHDERAYLLQAEIFAHGHWTAPSPPIAAFFEQMHVFVAPAVFAKYPPGHSLTLVPGIWLGLPGLMPAVLTGISAALTFWLARRLSGPCIALLTWSIWTTAPVTLIWGATYFSEDTSCAMWLAALCATQLWLDSGKPRYLVVVAVALAWGCEARPLTMAALAVPLAFVIVRRMIATRSWTQLIAPALVGVVILGLGPLWNHETLDGWRSDPYSYYSRTYFPFDKPGFGIDPTPPLRQLPRELVEMDAWSREVHGPYVPAAVPQAFVERILGLLLAFGTGWRLSIVVLLLAGSIHARGPARFCVAASLSLVTAYLAFAHPVGWTVYYFELLPMLAFVAAGELTRVLGLLDSSTSKNAGAIAAAAAPAVAVVLIALCLRDVVGVRTQIDERNAFHRQADRAIRSAPASSILFVRYPPSQNPHWAITRNEWDLASARTWVVYDRGADNARLMSIAPDRQAYLLDVSTFQLEPLTSPRSR